MNTNPERSLNRSYAFLTILFSAIFLLLIYGNCEIEKNEKSQTEFTINYSIDVDSAYTASPSTQFPNMAYEGTHIIENDAQHTAWPSGLPIQGVFPEYCEIPILPQSNQYLRVVRIATTPIPHETNLHTAIIIYDNQLIPAVASVTRLSQTSFQVDVRRKL